MRLFSKVLSEERGWFVLDMSQETEQQNFGRGKELGMKETESRQERCKAERARGGRLFLFATLFSFTFIPIDSGSVDTFSAAARVCE